MADRLTQLQDAVNAVRQGYKVRDVILTSCCVAASGQPLQQRGHPAADLAALAPGRRQVRPPRPRHRPHPALRADDRQDRQGYRGAGC